MHHELPAWLIPDPEHLGVTLARLALTVVVAWVLQRIGFLLIRRLERWLTRAANGQAAARQRARTLGATLRHLVTTTVAIGAVIHGLDVLGWDVKPLLVGASILGAALGFGAQFLVRDVIAGAFILIEDQFSVGDAVDVNGTVGVVEDVTLRSTRLRDYRGRLMFVPNGEMRIVINMSRDWHRTLVDVLLDPHQDPRTALHAAEEVAVALAQDPQLASRWLDPPQVLGIERVGPDGIVLRFALRTAPGLVAAQTAREVRLAVLTRLCDAGVRLANLSPRGDGAAEGA